MKNPEKIILGILAALLGYLSILGNSTEGIIASTFTVFAGIILFFFNVIYGIDLLRQGNLKTFLLKSLLPFILLYFTAVILNVFYWISFSDNASFEWGYAFRPFPHKESALLPVLYGLGLFYGYLRTNLKAVKITLMAAVLLLISGFIYLNIPADQGFNGQDEYMVLESEIASIEDVISAPEFKNKTLYIDLWYSNCSPCIRQFKEHLPSLKADLKKEGLDVEYVYLGRETSDLNSKQRWANAIKKYELKGWHYYFSKEKEPVLWSAIREQFPKDSLFGYPHYLISHNGKIISFNAPKPEKKSEVIEIIRETQEDYGG